MRYDCPITDDEGWNMNNNFPMDTHLSRAESKTHNLSYTPIHICFHFRMLVSGSKNSVPFQSPFDKSQIDMRQINKRKPNLIAYIRGIHTGMEIPKAVRQNEVYMSN